MRLTTFVYLVIVVAVSCFYAPAHAEPLVQEQSLASQPAVLRGEYDPASLAGREQYAVDIRLFDGERLVSETSIALLEGLHGVIDNRKTRMEDTGGEYTVPFQYLSSLIVLEAGPERCLPELGDTRRIVDDALEQAELIRVGPVSLWIYSPGTDRYEVKVDPIDSAEDGGPNDPEYLYSDSGCLPYMEPLEPEAVAADALFGGGQWWREGNY